MDESILATLHPPFATQLRLLTGQLHARRLDLRITCGLRTIAEQNRLYAQGRSKPGARVTNARGGQSPHNYGCAIDVIPVISGRRTYDVGSYWWNRLGEAVRSVPGLTWGGDFKSIKDRPHIEWTQWRTLRKRGYHHGQEKEDEEQGRRQRLLHGAFRHGCPDRHQRDQGLGLAE